MANKQSFNNLTRLYFRQRCADDRMFAREITWADARAYWKKAREAARQCLYGG